jgi:hypothetical protein
MIRAASTAGAALPVLTYISMLRAGDRRGEAARWGGRCGGLSRPGGAIGPAYQPDAKRNRLLLKSESNFSV